MTTFYLIRHGSNDFFQHTIVGRAPGVHLNQKGLREAALVAECLARENLTRVFSSPLERCRETAEPIAKKVGVAVEIAEELLEVDFGGWTGMKFSELETNEHWRRWNYFRGGVRAPRGETMMEVQARVVGFMENLRRANPEGRLALVSHGDPLRSAILFFLGAPLELIRRIEISPASLTMVTMDDWNAQVRFLNVRLGDQHFA